ncbi:hypothetical protein D3C72_1743930 [compost metagenome]
MLCATSAASSWLRGRRMSMAPTSRRGPGRPRAPLELMMLTRLAVRPGAVAAMRCAIMPPIEAPTMWARAMPSASSTPSESSAMSCSV